MKKNLLLIVLSLFCASMVAQDKTITLTDLNGRYFVEKNLSAADTVTSHQDTIDVSIKYMNPEYVTKLAVELTAAKVSTTDTIKVSLLGYDFAEDTSPDAIIASTTVSVANTNTITILTDDYQAGADEFSYRYYTIRVIHSGVGKGTKLKYIAFKAYVK